MPKPTKSELSQYKNLLTRQLAVLKGDVGSLRDEALRASDQDSSVDHLADQGTDNYDQGFMLGLIENEEETMQMIEEALDRLDEDDEADFGQCLLCRDEVTAKSRKKGDSWIPKPRLEYLPWARYCVEHQEQVESNREIA